MPTFIRESFTARNSWLHLYTKKTLLWLKKIGTNKNKCSTFISATTCQLSWEKVLQFEIAAFTTTGGAPFWLHIGPPESPDITLGWKLAPLWGGSGFLFCPNILSNNNSCCHFTSDEDRLIQRGIERHGFGWWKCILEDPQFMFQSGRTADSLKKKSLVDLFSTEVYYVIQQDHLDSASNRKWFGAWHNVKYVLGKTQK